MSSLDEPIRPRLLTTDEAARYCGVKRTTLYTTPGFPSPVRLNGPTGKPFYDVRDLDAWIDAIKAQQAAEDQQAADAARAVLARRRRAGGAA